MVITNRDLAAGTVLTANYKKQVVTCTVLKSEDGKTGYALENDNRVFSSPSAAGSAVMGGSACNGWRFWSVAGEAPASSTPPVTTKRKETGRKPTLLRQIRKLANQKGVPEGSVKYFCSACMKGFAAEGTEIPATCPEGHTREVHDDLAVAE